MGSYYGACLTRAGHDVHFLLRSDYEVVRAHGVRIRRAGGEFVARPAPARLPSEVGPCDLVIIALKTTANSALTNLLPPLIRSETAVLTLQNGLGNEEYLANLVGSERVLGGLCFVCLNRIAPGVIDHMAHGRIVLGEFRRPVSRRAQQMASWFRAAGVPCDLAENLECAHWEKLVWNIPFNGLGVAAAAGVESVLAGRVLDPEHLGRCLATDSLLASEEWLELVRELMDETIAAAHAQDLSVPSTTADVQIERTRQMGPYRASTLIDFEKGLPLELDSLFGEPLRRARGAGVKAARLGTLLAVLTQLDALRSAAPGKTG